MPNNAVMREHWIDTAAEGIRLDAWLAKRYPAVSYGAWQKALRSGAVKVNQTRITRLHDRLYPKDHVVIHLPDALLDRPLHVQVRYEDAHVIVVEKPQGLVACGEPGDTMARRVEAIYPGSVPCHRLDSHTGGLMLFARTPLAEAAVREGFAQRWIIKGYRALVVGHPKRQAQLDAFLIKDAKNSRVWITDEQRPGAMPVCTRYHLVSKGDELSLLNIELVTGKTHQIRAQLAHINHPIIGDDRYGNREMNRRYHAKGQALWACLMAFEFPQGHMLAYLNAESITSAPVFRLRPPGGITMPLGWKAEGGGDGKI